MARKNLSRGFRGHLNKSFAGVFFAITSILASPGAYAQEITVDSQKEELSNTMLNFIELQQKQLVSHLDSIKENYDPNLEVSPEDISILRRLRSVTKTIPLELNSQVKEYIVKYSSSNYRPYMNRLLGLSEHYFGIYDQVFDEMNLPQEIRYLSLVESSLNPHLISTSGAVGPWQFMYATAKLYNLEMNSNIDERKDVYAASYAVGQYLKEAYDQFDDWLLALASYNCGRGCVQRAIQRSGLNKPTFWELSPFLPKETRNYIPKYIAMTYVLSSADFYEIAPVSTELDFSNRLVMLDRKVDLTNIAKAVGITMEQLKYYNPAFKQNVVVASVEKKKRLLLPLTENTNDSLLYMALHDHTSVLSVPKVDESVAFGSNNAIKTYKVRSGETMTSVSRKFGISVQNLKAWNELSSSSKIIGRTLVVERPIDKRLARSINAASSKAKSNVLVYTVKNGDSLDRIANKYSGVTVAKLKADNGLKGNLIKPGMKLKINRG